MGENYFQRKLEFQRWEAAVAAAEKAAAEIVNTGERTDVAEQPSNIPSISKICQVTNSKERLFKITHSKV